MNSKAHTLPAYVPADAKPWSNEKITYPEVEALEGVQLVPSPFGIALHTILGTFSIFGVVVGFSILFNHLHRESEQVAAASFFLFSCCQLILSSCSFSKAFLSSSNVIVKFFRLGLPCIAATNLTACLSVAVGIGLNLGLGILASPFIFVGVFLPYFLYINNEGSCLRPYMKA